MSRFDKTLRSLFTALLLSAGVVAAGIHAAEPPAPAQGAAATSPSSPAATATTPAPAASASQGASDSGAHANAARQPTFCFQFTMRCLERKPAPSGSQGTAKRPLNLTAPDIRTVVSQEELQEPMPTADQQAQSEESDTVQVKGAPNTPDVPGGFGALWWALNHPTQAWRIFAPAE